MELSKRERRKLKLEKLRQESQEANKEHELRVEEHSNPEKKPISKLKVLSIGPLLAEDIKRTHEGLPMGVVYEEMYKKLEKKARK